MGPQESKVNPEKVLRSRVKMRASVPLFPLGWKVVVLLVCTGQFCLPALASLSSCAPGSYPSPSATEVTTLAGSGNEAFADGDSGTASFDELGGVAVSPDSGWVYVADTLNHRVRKVRTSDGQTSTLAGTGTDAQNDGAAGSGHIGSPKGLALSSDGLSLYVGTDRHTIRKVRTSDGQLSTLAGSGGQGSDDGSSGSATFYGPIGLCLSPDEVWMYVGDHANHKIRKVRVSNGEVFTVAGSGALGSKDGTSADATFTYPVSCSVTNDGAWVFVGDIGSDKVRKVRASDGAVFTLADSSAGLDAPSGGVLSADDAWLYVADHNNNKIRNIRTSDGEVFTMAGSGSDGSADGNPESSRFTLPEGLSLNADGTLLYVGDRGNENIRKIGISMQCVSCQSSLPHPSANFTEGCYWDCFNGHYKNISNCTACSPIDHCVDKITCTNVSDSFCTKCADGYEGGSCELALCPPGTTLTAWGSCIPCEPGYFKNETGFQNCTACPKHMTTTTGGASNIKDCSCDKGWTSFNGLSCQECKAGTFKDVIGFFACQDCRAGTTSMVASMSEENCILNQMALPISTVFPSTKKIQGQAGIWAHVFRVLNPEFAKKMDQVALDNQLVHVGSQADERCFNSISSIGTKFCYNISMHNQCNSLN